MVNSRRETRLEFACYRTSGFKDVRDEHSLSRSTIDRRAERAPSAVSLLSLLTRRERERERGGFVSFYMAFRKRSLACAGCYPPTTTIINGALFLLAKADGRCTINPPRAPPAFSRLEIRRSLTLVCITCHGKWDQVPFIHSGRLRCRNSSRFEGKHCQRRKISQCRFKDNGEKPSGEVASAVNNFHPSRRGQRDRRREKERKMCRRRLVNLTRLIFTAKVPILTVDEMDGLRPETL